MRITPSVLLAALVACGSPAKSAEPTEPARSVGTASSADDDAPASEASSAAAAATDADRIAAAIVPFQSMVTALEPADGDCEALAKRIDAFADTDEAEQLRAQMDDDELTDFMKAHRAEIERDHGALMGRFMAVVKPCQGDEDVEKAWDRSKLTTKRTEDGRVIEDDER